MTKQEEIREGMAECYYYFAGWDGETKWEDVKPEDREIAYDFADKVLEWEVSQGVVIKVDRELLPKSLTIPKVPEEDFPMEGETIEVITIDLPTVKALKYLGCGYFEPLIGGKG